MPSMARRPFAPRQRVFEPLGPKRHRVAMFVGCVMPYMYADSEDSTLQVLRRNGCEVVIPEQHCCGALLIHGGDREPARALARRNVDAFLDAGVDAIIVNAAGCGSTLKEYHELLAHDSAYRDRAERFSGFVRDVTEFLAAHEIDRTALGPIHARVTYQDSCHLAHAQRIKESPRTLISAIPGVELVELASDRCCGSAGIYNVTQREMSMEVLASKMDEVEEVSPDIVVTANPGCMLQLETGARHRGMNARVMHVVDLLEASYRAAEERPVEDG
jgi:glycolate oxidase iron-sulfur subunit